MSREVQCHCQMRSLGHAPKTTHQPRNGISQIFSQDPCQVFFLSDCCVAQRSLFGRSPFCQRKLSEESQIHWKSVSLKTTNESNNEKNHQPQCSLPESAEAGRCGLFLGRLDQGLVGNAESTHVNRPEGEGNACSIGWKMLQILKVEK